MTADDLDPRVVLEHVDRHGVTPRQLLAHRLTVHFHLPLYQAHRLIAHAVVEDLISIDDDEIVRPTRKAVAS